MKEERNADDNNGEGPAGAHEAADEAGAGDQDHVATQTQAGEGLKSHNFNNPVHLNLLLRAMRIILVRKRKSFRLFSKNND